MSDQHRLVVRIAPDGTVSAETKGVTGEKCLDYIATLEDLLDAETVTSTYTEDHTRTEQRANIAQEDRNELGQS